MTPLIVNLEHRRARCGGGGRKKKKKSSIRVTNRVEKKIPLSGAIDPHET